MHTGVYCERRTLDELLTAAWMIADVWSDAAVYTLYRLVSRGHAANLMRVLPCRARSLRLAKPFEHVEQAKALGKGFADRTVVVPSREL